MATSHEELKELEMNLAKIYSLLSRIFREEVDGEFLEDMKSCISRQLNIDAPEISEGYTELRNFLEKNEINKELVEDLAADYASLFLGIGKYPAHPYESVYLSEDKIIMRKPWNDVVRAYREEGLQKVEWFKEPEDHIAIELEFMTYLSLEISEALEKREREVWLHLLNVQNKFLSNHLKKWIPRFCRDVEKGSQKHTFYKALAKITERFIVVNQENIAKIYNELRT
jgi:TorA maturation chaperone TorD